MADEQIGAGFDQYLGLRTNPQGSPEFYNKQTNTGFSDPNALAGFVNSQYQRNDVNANNVFNVVKQGIVNPLQVNLPQQVPATTLQNPTSQLDVNNLIAENKKYRDQLLTSFKPSEQETELQKQLFTLQNQQRNVELSKQAGFNAVETKPIALEFQTGQKAAIERQANLQLQTNAFQQQPLLQNLQLLQQQRQAQLQSLQQQEQFGQTAINTALKLQDIQNQEQKTAKEFALQYRVTQPFYTVDGKTAYNTLTGRPISTPQEYVAQGGNGKFTDIQHVSAPLYSKDSIYGDAKNGYFTIDPHTGKQTTLRAGTGNAEFGKIGETVDEEGNKTDVYGFADSSNKTVTSIGGSNLVSSNPYNIGGYDIRSYATDPTHEVKVQNIYNKIGDVSTAASINAYIQSVAKGSPVSGQMVLNAAQTYNVDPKLMMALMQQDSTFGKYGKAVSTKNPGNVGNTDSGNTNGFATWQDGVNAVARNLSQRRISSSTDNQTPSATVQAYAAQYASTGQIPTGMKVPFSKVAQTAKEFPKVEGTIVDQNTGVRPAKLTDPQYEGIASLYDVVHNKLPILLQSYQKLDKSLVGRLGSIVHATQDRQDFRTTKNEILNLLLKARSGSAVSDSEYFRYLSMLPSEVSLTGSTNKINSAAKSLSDTLNARLRTEGLVIYGYSTVKVNGKDYKVGDVLQNENGQQARVNPDGSLTLVQ